ncbi:xylan 1,4-beta-xylosidase [Granulicella rosea]|uniref:Xylan 1,4-beta-xylosidase n=1 Tax=Granulicella rosea TaxID=474952 RepID=A0A239EI53_9BACT|nr:beta-xylosidase [Granulicella rosea]SNS43592.1 xylan 1,4-beta-xylosidase [Granulicella rosea]
MVRLWKTTAAMLAGLSLCAAAQQPAVKIHIDAAHPMGDYKPVWNYFGADEPNYSYAPNGAKLLRELSAIDPATPVYFRPHNLLTTGDGEGSLKWGSTNVYTERPDGSPVYDWTITDRLFDNLKAAHVRPMVEIGFMPEALSPHPEPYRHGFPAKPDVYTGWSYPPKDYAKWRALIVSWVEHLHARYGADVDTWEWEVWNEPDIQYFHGTPAEYFKLYDITTGAVRQVLPHAIVGGPAATGPYPSEKKPFFHDFLEHCARGLNADTGKTGAPLDFISFHPKGSPQFKDGHVTMGLARQLAATDEGMRIVAEFPEYKQTPLILSESDPEGCAACQGPRNGYRNGALYGVSVAEMLARSSELARRRGVNLLGAVTWAFEFEGQPWFAGFRDLATNGVDKPVLNVFRMYGKLGGKLLPVTSTGALTVDEILQHGVTVAPDVNGIATRQGNTVAAVLWNYHDEDVDAAPARLELEVDAIPAKQVQVTQYRMDHDHGNAYTEWLAMGSPQKPTVEQIATLGKVGGLATMEDITVKKTATEPVRLKTSLPRQGVALYLLSW